MAAGGRPIGTLAALATAALIALAPLSAAAQEQGPSQHWFETPTLNRGLGPAPADLGRRTPQETLDAFLEETRAENWARAAHLLDLTSIDPAEQAETGPALARWLAEVVERKLWIDWSELSDRPDALVETGGRDSPLTGQPRRSQRLGTIEVDGRPIVVRLNRVKPEGGDPVWVFAESTVDRIPMLHAEHGPGWFEGVIPESWNGHAGSLALRRWELVVLPLYVLAGVLLFLGLRSLFGWLAQKAPSRMIRDAAASARMPVALTLAAGAALLGMGRVFTFSAPVSAIARPVLLALLIVGVTIAVLRAIDAVIDVVTRRYVGEISDQQSRDERQFYTSLYAFRRVIVLVAVIAGAGLLLTELNVAETLGISLLASAGVLAVLLGIAGRAILGNILASLQIAISKPIRIGDSVMYEDRWAYVDAIFYTHVRLRTWDNRRFIVPVTYFVAHPFENLSMQEAKMTRTFELVLDHEADAQQVREAFMQIAEKDEDAMDGELTKMLVMDHGLAGQTMRFYATAPDPSAAWNMHARLREEMIRWVRENHPEWWPRERELETGRGSRREAAPRRTA